MLEESTISPVDLAYAAGIIDGEGTIYLTETAPNRRRNEKTPRFALIVGCGMTTPQVPYGLRSTFGGGVSPDRNKKKPIWKPSYLWRLHGKHAALFLSSIRSFLKLKGAQADLGILFANECIQNTRFRRQIIAPEEVIKRHECVLRMRELNKKGNPVAVDGTILIPIDSGKLRIINGDKTHCPAGHPYEGDNLYIDPSTTRRCRLCLRGQRRQKYLREKTRDVASSVFLDLFPPEALA